MAIANDEVDANNYNLANVDDDDNVANDDANDDVDDDNDNVANLANVDANNANVANVNANNANVANNNANNNVDEYDDGDDNNSNNDDANDDTTAKSNAPQKNIKKRSIVGDKIDCQYWKTATQTYTVQVRICFQKL